MLVLTRCQPDRNMARFYALAIEDSLFGDAALLRYWGRLGTRGREVRELHASAELAQAALARWRHRKIRRGYGPAATAETPVVS